MPVICYFILVYARIARTAMKRVEHVYTAVDYPLSSTVCRSCKDDETLNDDMADALAVRYTRDHCGDGYGRIDTKPPPR